jgi:hypothetical protein
MDTTEHKKKALIEALEASLGVVSTACRAADVGRTTYYIWRKEDPDFARICDEIENIALDFVESQLFKQIKNENTAATIFYLKTKGKNRGYSERTEITGMNGEPIQPFQIIIPPRQD